MPVNHRFDSNVLVLQPASEYTPADLKQALLAALADPACPAAPSVLLDLSDSRELLSRSSDQIIDMAEFLLAHRPRLGDKQAIVVASTAAYGLVRMGAVYATSNGIEPRVFRDHDEALAWLRS